MKKRSFGNYMSGQGVSSSAVSARRPKKFRSNLYAQRAALLSIVPRNRSLLPSNLRSRVGHEIKYADIPNASYIFPVTSVSGWFTPLNIISDGAGPTQRIGRKIVLKSIQFKGSLDVDGLSTTVTGYGRYMIIYDRQPNGITPPLTSLLQTYTTANVSSVDSTSMVNMDYRDRFTILKDKTVLFPSSTLVGYPTFNPADAICDFFLPIPQLVTHFQANGGTIADIATGALYLVTFSDITPATNPLALNGTFRLRYTDI
nr:MAG: capsid protein [Cressdnaviricota sp.]